MAVGKVFTVGFELIRSVASQGLMYVLIVAGVWVVVATARASSARERAYHKLGIALLGIGLGLLGVTLTGLR